MQILIDGLGVARTPVFGVRGSSLASAAQLEIARLSSCSEVGLKGRAADLNGGVNLPLG